MSAPSTIDPFPDGLDTHAPTIVDRRFSKNSTLRDQARRWADFAEVGPLRRLVAWLGWNEGLLTLRAIAASLRLRSEGYVSSLIRQCDREFGTDAGLLRQLDAALIALRV